MSDMVTRIDFTNERYTLDDLRIMRTTIEEEILRRKEILIPPRVRREHGSHWTRLKLRTCKGCGEVYSGRDMRTHSCKVAWPDR